MTQPGDEFINALIATLQLLLALSLAVAPVVTAQDFPFPSVTTIVAKALLLPLTWILDEASMLGFRLAWAIATAAVVTWSAPARSAPMKTVFATHHTNSTKGTSILRGQSTLCTLLLCSPVCTQGMLVKDIQHHEAELAGSSMPVSKPRTQLHHGVFPRGRRTPR